MLLLQNELNINVTNKQVEDLKNQIEQCKRITSGILLSKITDLPQIIQKQNDDMTLLLEGSERSVDTPSLSFAESINHSVSLL